MSVANAQNNMLGGVTVTSRSNSATYALDINGSYYQLFDDPGFTTGDKIQLPDAALTALGKEFMLCTASSTTALEVRTTGGDLVATLASFYGAVRVTCVKQSSIGGFEWVVSCVNGGTLSFTPAVTFSTPGDLSVSYAYRSGYWQQVGKMILIGVAIRFTPTYTTSSGTFRVTGFPIDVGNGAGNGWGGALAQNGFSATSTNPFTYPAGITTICARLSGQIFTLEGLGSNTQNTSLTVTQFPTATERYIEFYMTVGSF